MNMSTYSLKVSTFRYFNPRVVSRKRPSAAHHITAYHIVLLNIWCHIISYGYRIASYQVIRVRSDQIRSYQITSNHIRSCHVMSCQIIPYHILSYLIVLRVSIMHYIMLRGNTLYQATSYWSIVWTLASYAVPSLRLDLSASDESFRHRGTKLRLLSGQTPFLIFQTPYAHPNPQTSTSVNPCWNPKP